MHFMLNFIVYKKIVLNSFINTIHFLNFLKVFKKTNKFIINIGRDIPWMEMSYESAQNLHNLLILISVGSCLIGGTAVYIIIFKADSQNTT